jgi:predicted RNase H-like HicB family nuclease
MKLKVVLRQAEEGGYWAEVPAIPGCVTQGETFEELLGNIYEAVEACLSTDIAVDHRLRRGKKAIFL